MQDCGAAGITSAAIEMAERSNLGLSLDIRKFQLETRNDSL
ncbi:MAG: hypothetical protein Ct9H90mP2_07430 [Dehalococcoidia bacterium]|nr:MAG: hypothetical protein Ct9H90mP2_07430 [Dehalococcoidia bacterium]